MFQEVYEEISRGLNVGGVLLFAKRAGKGRLKEEREADIWYRLKDKQGHLLYVRTFEGRRPGYLPWVEFFGIEPYEIKYFDGPLERALIYLFSEPLPGGGRMFVEYLEDEETMAGLSRGYPVAVTRLGYILFQNGFTWFKDWYFPEGLREGNVKLQGEKPLNEEARRRHLNAIYGEVEAFLSKAVGRDVIERKAIERGRIVIEIARGFG